MARLGGFEPPTHCLEGSCSIQMSYRRHVKHPKSIGHFGLRIVVGDPEAVEPFLVDYHHLHQCIIFHRLSAAILRTSTLMTNPYDLPKRFNWLRAIAIIFPILLPASYLIQSIQGVAITQLVAWMLYTGLLYVLPIKRRWLYTLVLILASTFLLSITGSLLSLQGNAMMQLGPILISAILLTIGTLLFSAFAWGIFLILDSLIVKIIQALWLKPKHT